MRKTLAVLLFVLMLCPVCRAQTMIGVAMPDDDPFAARCAEIIAERLARDGCAADVRLIAEGEHVAQLESMLGGGCVALIAGLDAVPAYISGDAYVVSFLTEIPEADFAVATDHYLIGAAQARAVLQALENSAAETPYAVELLFENADSIESLRAYLGAWDVLKPYINSGEVMIPSGLSSFEAVTVDSGGAQDRLSYLLDAYYPDGVRPHAVVTQTDALALAVRDACGEGTLCTVRACFMEEQMDALCEEAARAAEALAQGETPVPNDIRAYSVPAFVSETILYAAEDLSRALLPADAS